MDANDLAFPFSRRVTPVWYCSSITGCSGVRHWGPAAMYMDACLPRCWLVMQRAAWGGGGGWQQWVCVCYTTSPSRKLERHQEADTYHMTKTAACLQFQKKPQNIHPKVKNTYFFLLDRSAVYKTRLLWCECQSFADCGVASILENIMEIYRTFLVVLERFWFEKPKKDCDLRRVKILHRPCCEQFTVVAFLLTNSQHFFQ